MFRVPTSKVFVLVTPGTGVDNDVNVSASNGRILSFSQTIFTGPPQIYDRFSQAFDVLQQHLENAEAEKNLLQMAIAHAGTAIVFEVCQLSCYIHVPCTIQSRGGRVRR